MNDEQKELERLRRLRNQQIRSRDPGTKQRKLQHNITQQYQRTSKQMTLGSAWATLHHRWKGLIIGLVFGIIVAVVLSLTTDESWTELIGILAIIMFALIGLVIGSSFDWRDEIRDI